MEQLEINILENQIFCGYDTCTTKANQMCMSCAEHLCINHLHLTNSKLCGVKKLYCTTCYLELKKNKEFKYFVIESCGYLAFVIIIFIVFFNIEKK